MVDEREMKGKGGVVMEEERNIESLKEWDEEGRKRGENIWMKIKNKGRKMKEEIGKEKMEN